jgi:hypothetical protein
MRDEMAFWHENSKSDELSLHLIEGHTPLGAINYSRGQQRPGRIQVCRHMKDADQAQAGASRRSSSRSGQHVGRSAGVLAGRVLSAQAGCHTGCRSSTIQFQTASLEALHLIYAKFDATTNTAYQKTVLKLLCQVRPPDAAHRGGLNPTSTQGCDRPGIAPSWLCVILSTRYRATV